MSSFHALEQILGQAFPLRYRGAVHNIYTLPGKKLLSVVSNRRSVYGFRLGFEIEGQGDIINAFNIAASNKLQDIDPHYEDDLLAYGSVIDQYLPQELKNRPYLQRCATVVSKIELLPIRSVTRYILTGSPLEEYNIMRSVSDRMLEPFLYDGAPIPGGAIWAPTLRKSPLRDEPFSYRKAGAMYPDVERLDLQVFQAFSRFAYERGVIVVDSKKDIGLVYDEIGRGMDLIPSLVWGGERFTPDTTRFVYAKEYEKAVMCNGKGMPPAQDKQILRDWAFSVSLRHMDPADEGCRNLALRLVPQASVLERYRVAQTKLFEVLYDMSISDFQRSVMNIKG